MATSKSCETYIFFPSMCNAKTNEVEQGMWKRKLDRTSEKKQENENERNSEKNEHKCSTLQ